MKGLLWIAISVGLVAGVGVVVGRAAGWPAHGRELAIAAAISMLSGAAGLVPQRFVRAGDVTGKTQMALVGTLAQMMLSLGLVMAASVTGLAADRTALIWWVLAMYWAVLAALVASLVGQVRRAATGPAGPQPM